MKNLIKLLPIVALFIGTSVAFATTSVTKLDPPTHYNTAGIGQPPVWQPITGELLYCDETNKPCTAIETEPNVFMPTLDRGVAVFAQ
ncbi:MAG: DUF6520 family protein [Bacteroidota bacterium]